MGLITTKIATHFFTDLERQFSTSYGPSTSTKTRIAKAILNNKRTVEVYTISISVTDFNLNHGTIVIEPTWDDIKTGTLITGIELKTQTQIYTYWKKVSSINGAGLTGWLHVVQCK